MLDKVTVIAIKNPFQPYDREIRTVDWVEGETIHHYISDYRPLPDTEFVASINGRIVPLDTPVYPGDYVAVCPVPQGGGGGKDILRTIAFVALIVTAAAVTPHLAPWAAETFHIGATTASALTSTAIMMGGSMLINAVLPPPKPDLPQIDISDPFKESPTYSWGPLRQTTVQGGPIPILYGTHRIAGQVLSQSVTVDGNKQILNLLLGVCHGPIDSISDIRINDQPVSYYKGVATYTRLGTLNDEVIEGFDEVVSQQDFGQKLGSVTHQTDGNAVEKIEIDITAPYGCYYANDQGGLDTRQADFKVEYREVGASEWTLAGNYSISGATSQAIRRTITIDNLTPAQYEVRVTRTNTESSSARERTTIYWVAMREIIKQALIYPGIAKYAIRALATDQLSGGVPSVSCLASRLTVQVYNPSTGEWESKDARNPAWAAYDLLVNETYGAGIPHSRIIYDDFSSWASYCDEIVDGKPRFRLNMVLDAQMDLWKALLSICQIGRAIPVRRGTKYGVIVDRPSTPVQLFTMGNIIQGSFKLSYLPKKDRANAIEVSYIDADRDYTRQVVAVYTDEYNESSEPDNKTSMRLFGCTDRDQVIREAAYRLNSTRWLVRTIEFDADIDAIACQVGDLIYFQHDVPNYERDFSGRLVGATSNTVTLDREVTLQPDTSYAVLVRLSDDTLVEKEVESVTEETTTDTLTLTSEFSTVPEKYDLYAFGEVSSYKRPYRVTSITRSKDLTRHITAVEYIEDIYTDTGYVFEQPTWQVAYQEAVQVYAHEFLTWAPDGTYKTNVAVTWHPAISTEGFSWAVWLEDITAGTDPVRVGTSSDRNFVIPSSYLTLSHQYRIYVVGADQGPVEKNFYPAWQASTDYNVGDYVVPTTSNGHRYVCTVAGTSGSDEPDWPTESGATVEDGSVTWQEAGVSGNSTLITVLGEYAPPSDVASFDGVFDSITRMVKFTWTAISDIDLDHYEIRKGGSSWDDATVAISHATGTSASLYIEDATQDTIRYWIKAVDKAGVYSINAAYVDVDIDTSSCPLQTPTGLTLETYNEIASDGTDRVYVRATWNNNAETSDKFHHYELRLTKTSSGHTSQYATVDTQYTWEVLPNTEYSVTVRAVDIAGNATSWATAVSITSAKDTIAPSTPTWPSSGAIIAGFKVIGLKWNANSEADLDSYEVERSDTGDFTGEEVSLGRVYTHFFVDNDLEVNKQYWYRIRAWDTSGNASDWSEVKTTTTLQVGSADIAYNSILADHISVNQLSAISGNLGTIVAGLLQSQNWGASNGVRVNLDEGTIEFGGSDSPKLKWDGTTLSVEGQVTITGGSGLANLSDANADSISETSSRKWAGESGADRTPPLPSDEGLVGYWSFDEGEGTTAGDSSGHGNNGTIYGASWADGVSGKALSFDGEDDYVDLQPFGPGETPNSFTVSFWMYSQVPVGSTSHCFILKPVGGTVSNRYEISFHNGNQITLELFDGTNNSAISTQIDNPQGNWHHIATVFEHDKKQEIYIDGQLARGATPGFSGGIGESDRYFLIGAEGWWGDGYNIYFNGLIDEVRIYNRALTAEEIKALYLNPGGLKAPYPGATKGAPSGTYIGSSLPAENVEGWAHPSNTTKIDGGKIECDSLSAISANLGTITAGLARSSDSKLQVDFDNKWIRVYDANNVLRVQLGYLP